MTIEKIIFGRQHGLAKGLQTAVWILFCLSDDSSSTIFALLATQSHSPRLRGTSKKKMVWKSFNRKMKFLSSYGTRRSYAGKRVAIGSVRAVLPLMQRHFFCGGAELPLVVAVIATPSASHWLADTFVAIRLAFRHSLRPWRISPHRLAPGSEESLSQAVTRWIWQEISNTCYRFARQILSEHSMTLTLTKNPFPWARKNYKWAGEIMRDINHRRRNFTARFPCTKNASSR